MQSNNRCYQMKHILFKFVNTRCWNCNTVLLSILAVAFLSVFSVHFIHLTPLHTFHSHINWNYNYDVASFFHPFIWIHIHLIHFCLFLWEASEEVLVSGSGSISVDWTFGIQLNFNLDKVLLFLFWSFVCFLFLFPLNFSFFRSKF